ncbi:MAG TPA: M6 family metalloprotease domain-containing protein [Longimicrobium sp.]|nr:M6 family metalloprotease domain-containing protein [Longimicrobium sp.]
MTRRIPLFLAATLLAAAAVIAAPPAAAQDMELRSALSGVPLPPAYYERIRRDPGAFEFRHGFRNRLLARAADGPSRAEAPTTGELTVVVVLAMFADSPEPPVTGAQVHEQLFGANPRGNLTQYYHETSSGRIRVTGAVRPWVRSRVTRAEAAGNSYGFGGDANLTGFLRHALQLADATTDFGQFDNDGPDRIPNSGDDDGTVDLLAVNFEGPDATCGVASLWPYRAAFSDLLGSPYATNDRTHGGGSPILLNDYLVQSAMNCDGSPQNIAVMAHEMGHAFGLPDFYDASGGILPGQRHWVLGCWTLMAAGAWGCGPSTGPILGQLPPQMGPWEKLHLGWGNPQVAEPGWRRQYVLRPVQGSGDLLRVPLRGNNEYLLLEYRPNTGFDAGLPGGGVLVFHVDTLRPLDVQCNGCKRIYHVGLVEADGDEGLLKTHAEGGNRGVAGDVWTGRRVLDALSTPALTLNSGLAANVALEIEVLGPEARITVSTLATVAPASLLAPVLGSPGTGPTAEERLSLDHFGNRDGRYDLGDLRAYMRSRPLAVVPPS